MYRFARDRAAYDNIPEAQGEQEDRLPEDEGGTRQVRSTNTVVGQDRVVFR